MKKAEASEEVQEKMRIVSEKAEKAILEILNNIDTTEALITIESERADEEMTMHAMQLQIASFVLVKIIEKKEGLQRVLLADHSFSLMKRLIMAGLGEELLHKMTDKR